MRKLAAGMAIAFALCLASGSVLASEPDLVGPPAPGDVAGEKEHLQPQAGERGDKQAAKHHSPDHASIFTWILGEETFDKVRAMIGESWIDGTPPKDLKVAHLFFGAFTALLALLLALFASSRLRKEEDYLLPSKKFGAFAFFDIVIDTIYTFMCSLMPRDKAREALPLVTAVATFILFANCGGLIPGLLPPTDSLNMNAAMAILVFLLYNYWGIKTQGIGNYLKHLCGPMWAIAPLMFIIELIGHLVRPCTLAIRLMGNMFADHKLLGLAMLFPLLPLPVMALGLLVCVVQTLVFTLLTIVYISMAVEEHEHEEGEHAPAH